MSSRWCCRSSRSRLGAISGVRVHDRGHGHRRGDRWAVRSGARTHRNACAGELRGRLRGGHRCRRSRSRPMARVDRPRLVGAASVGFLSKANSTCNWEARPSMRGRVMALWAVAFLGSTPIGGPIAGAVAEHFGGRAGLALGSVACLTAAALGWLALRKFRTRQAAELHQLLTRRLSWLNLLQRAPEPAGVPAAQASALSRPGGRLVAPFVAIDCWLSHAVRSSAGLGSG